MLSVVLAGGEGRRLWPLTADRAKPAVPVGGRYRLIDFVLSNLVNGGLFKIVVLTQYKSHSLDRHIAQTWRLSAMLGNYVATVPAQMRRGPYWFAGSADDAQDLTQEVFIKMYRTLSSYDQSKGAFVTWVTTITRNLLVDHFRKTKQDRMTDSIDTTASDHEDAQPLSEQIPDRSSPPDARVRSREVSETVHAALARISPELREAVILRDLQDMDYREIATVLKVPEGTVKSRINRGRAELARLLQRTYRQVM